MNKIKNSIPSRIKYLRKTLELTQKEFSNRIKISRSTIGNIENGTNTISDQLIHNISKEYGIREEWIKKGKGEMRKSPENIIMEAVKYLSDVEIKAALNKLNDRFNPSKPEEDDKATLYKILDFLKEQYKKGDQDMRGYLTIKLKKAFPEYEEYIENTMNKKEE
ncbi:helix-turn-helix domain-containing protein [Iocasia frigidifontis]|uniref:Helix-turn-helix domain-containing protein n=1 Tax=Iocasia fonsfrigidae TaxID=2682810 RepID=A0A8A7K8F2_9FIRM|nr:helix-turn-helix transcriptional regulator [Iocasia fonsfrigidae]QTL97480.1 helix-turn-helix domain-containing protein [Iocasia fonsfrigidae]